MELTPMQYKGYVWPHNPRTYTISYERQVATHKVPFGRYVLQDLGLTRRVMRGEGIFYGPGAYEEFKRLASVFYQDGPGTLLHPVWQSAQAYFVELALVQEPRKDYVRYTFTFWEDQNRYSQGLSAKNAGSGQTAKRQAGQSGAQVHTVGQGETLWGIARAYGLTVGQLLEYNPQVKNPNTVAVGEKIRVR